MNSSRSAREASWRRAFDPCSPLLFILYHYLEQNLHFWLVPEPPQVLAARSFLVAGFDTLNIPRSISCGHLWNHVTYESRCVWVMSHMSHVLYESCHIRICHVTYVDESCHIWVTLRVSHVTYESCPIWVISHMSHVIFQRVTLHIHINHVIFSFHIYLYPRTFLVLVSLDFIIVQTEYLLFVILIYISEHYRSSYLWISSYKQNTFLPLFPSTFQHSRLIVCCSVLQCVVVCCSVLQCVVQCGAVCCLPNRRQIKPTRVFEILHENVIFRFVRDIPQNRYPGCIFLCVAVCCSVLQCLAVCCSVLQCVAVCCSVLQCVAVCCSMLQCVAVCCSVCVLQCVAVCCSVL